MDKIIKNHNLLISKFYGPRVSQNTVLRTHLIEKLETDSERPITLVSAPTGYGKSILVKQWLERQEQPSTWISLDDRDNDLSLFLKYLHSAIDQIFPGECKISDLLLRAESLPEIDQISTVLVNDISQLYKRFYLVLDDYQLISNQKIHDLMNELLRFPLQNMHLVFISRTDPPLPLVQYLSKNQITIIPSDALRFTYDETNELLTKCIPGKFEKNVIKPLIEKMSGWVTGISLTILSLYEGQHLKIDDIANSSAVYLQEYLNNEVTKNINPEMAQYLLECSVLDEFCTPLIDYISSSTPNANKRELTAKKFMLDLDKTHLFVNCMECENRWCSLHPVFKDYLRNKVINEWSEEDLAKLHESASDWFEENGYIKEAIKHSHMAGNKEKAYSIFDRNNYQGLNGGKWNEVEEWLKGMSEQAKRKRPHVLPSGKITFTTSSGAPVQLTKRETEVLKLIGQGLSSKEMAASLFLSVETIKKHIYRIFQKFDTHSRTETLIRATELGILNLQAKI